MKQVAFISLLLVLIASFPVYADSLVRVQCEDEDAGAEIFLNGKFVGECPVDASVEEGTVQLRARKIVDDDHEKIFEKKLRVVEGVSQRVELVMSASQLTAEGRQRKAVAEATAQLRAAEAGDIEAMKQMAERYDGGTGVGKDPSKAELWRSKAASAAADAAQKEKLRAAEIARAESARREAAIQIKQDRIREAAPFRWSRIMTPLASSGEPKLVSTGLTVLPTFSLVDITELPSQLTKTMKLKNEAALRPSTWGKPDSMIARASLQQKASSAATEKSLLVAAAE